MKKYESMENMKDIKRYVTHKNIALALLFVIFLFSNLIPPAGIAGGNFYEYSSGGYAQGDTSSAIAFSYSSIPYENYYHGTMNWVLRPLSKVIPLIDIRVTGFLLFIIVFALFGAVIYKMNFKKKWHAVLFEFMAVFVFGDFAYLLHYNTMTTQGLLLCSMLVMTLILLWQFHIKASIAMSIIYAFLCLFAGGLSEGWFILGILLNLLTIPTFFVRKDKKYIIATSAACVLSIIAVSALFSGGVSEQIKYDNLVNATFYGIYKDNPYVTDNEKMDKALIEKYSGKSNFEINEKIDMDYTYSDILGYYLKNPSFFKQKLEISAGNAFEIRARYLANQPDGSLKNGFTLYSAIKRRFMQPDLWFIVAVALGIMVFCGLNIKGEENKGIKAHYCYMIILALISLYAFLTPVIISGEAGISEKLFLYNIIFDIMLVNAVVGGSIIASARRDKLKEKYGVNQ